MWKSLRTGVLWLLWLTVLFGLLYPLTILLVAGAFFPGRASGSLQVRDGRVVGSALIGQPFSGPGFFWGRPSSTSPGPCDGTASGGSNLGPLNPALREVVRGRVERLRSADPGNEAPIPIDLVTASGSGLDPHISPAAAHYQVPRVARARGLSAAALHALIERMSEGRSPGFFGERRVNVLALNLALEKLSVQGPP